MTKKRLILTFPANLVDQPITYQLVKKFDLMVNILRAQITPEEQGKMTVEISGSAKNFQTGIDFLAGLGVGVRPLAQEVKWIEDRCIECSACTTICPTGALFVTRPEMRVYFDKEKCIACELCLPACPYGAVGTDRDDAL